MYIYIYMYENICIYIYIYMSDAHLRSPPCGFLTYAAPRISRCSEGVIFFFFFFLKLKSRVE